MVFERDDEDPPDTLELSNGFRIVVYSWDKEPVVLLSVTDEKGAGFGVEMTATEAQEVAKILQRAAGLEPQAPPPAEP